MDSRNHSLVRPPTASELINKCQAGSVKNLIRYNMLFLRALIEKEDFYFKLQYEHSQRGRIFTRCDKLFLRNGRDAYNIYGPDLQLKNKLYSVEKYLTNTRLNETKLFAHKASICSSLLTPRDRYRPMLLLLTDANLLLRFDFDSGELLQTIYLGSLQRIKFSYIGWERYHETILIQSNDLKKSSEIINYNIIMSIWPLKFVGCFKIEKSFFKGQRSPNIAEGLLVLSNRDQYINVYSLLDVLSPENYLWKTDLDEICDQQKVCDECICIQRIVGREGHGLPTNIRMKIPPRLLMRVQTSYPSLEFSAYPYHYIYSPRKERDTFTVVAAEDHIPVINGTITYENFCEDHHLLMFHEEPMDSRILSLDSHKLTFYKIVNNVLTKLFDLSSTPIWYLDNLHQRLTSTKKAQKNDTMFKSIFNHTCDGETGIYYLLGVDLSAEKLNIPVISMYDNYSGRLLKRFCLDFKAEETNDYELLVSRDLLMVNEVNTFGPSKVLCYRLSRKN